MTNEETLRLAHAKGYRITEDGVLLSPRGKPCGSPRKDGYLVFRPCKNSPQIRVHRLQAFQKYGEDIFLPGIVVRHLDGNPSNNRADNIAIGTASDNRMDMDPRERHRTAVMASRAAQKHDHAAIVAKLRRGFSYRQIMAEFGIKSKGTVSFIARKSMEAMA